MTAVRLDARRARRIAMAVILSAGLAFYLALIMRGALTIDGRIYFTLFDDAMISMRYAKTFAAGGGLNWNPGDVPVEGVTNLLWTLWMSVLHRAPAPEGFKPLLLSLSSAACLFAAAIGAQRLSRILGASETVSLAVLALALLYYPLVYWSLRGMETGALSALMTWAMVVALRHREEPSRAHLVALCAMAAALVLVRQDAVVFIAVLGGFLVATGWPKRMSSGFVVLACAAAALALLTAFRWIYFGDITPNTYTLKVTGVTLGERLERGLSSLFSQSMLSHYALFAASFLLAVPSLRAAPRRQLLSLALPVSAFLAQAAYSVYVGGDVWEFLNHPNRFLVVVMPGLIAATAVCLHLAITSLAKGRLTPTLQGAVFAALAAVIGLQASAVHALSALRYGPHYVDNDKAAAQAGLCLRETTPPGTRIAVSWAGTLPYYADRFSVDLLGKMDREIAASTPQRDFLPGHNKWDYAYSLTTYKPDMVLQVWGDRPEDIVLIRSLGYDPIDPAWPCFAGGFLVPGQVFVRRS